MPLHDLSTAAASGGLTVVYDSTLGADAASFDATGIAGTYKCLQGYITARGTGATTVIVANLTFNGDTGGSSYVWQLVSGSGSVAGATNDTSDPRIRLFDFPGSTSPSNEAGTGSFFIHNYAGTTFSKQVVGYGGSREDTTVFNAQVTWGSWQSTSAITQVTITPHTGNWLAGSHMTIFGV